MIKKFILNNYLFMFILYYCALFMEATSLEVDYPYIEVIAKYVRYVAYLLFFVRIIFLLPEYKKDILSDKWKSKAFIIKCIYVLIEIMFISILINFFTTKNKRIIFLILVLLASYKTDYNKIIKTTMKLQIILTSILVLLSILGITQNFIVPRKDKGLLRYSLGFVYTTNLAQMIVFSSILYLYTEKLNVKIKDLFVIQTLNVFTYFITNSRTEFIMLEVILLITFIWKLLAKVKKGSIIEKTKKIYSSIFSHTFFIYPFISLIIVMCYPLGGIWNKFNVILSNRLQQTYDNIIIYGIKPFGEKINFLGLGLKDKIQYGNYKSNFVDNEYIKMMFTEGWIFAICFIAILSLLLIMLYKTKKYKEVMLCSIYLMFSLINPRIVNILYCPILFMIIPTVLKFKSVEKNKLRKVCSNGKEISN